MYICKVKSFGKCPEIVPIAVQTANIQRIYEIAKYSPIKNVMAIKRKVIVIPRGSADKICTALKIGRTTLYAALNYTSNSDDAKLTRQKVLSEYGGIQTTKVIP